VEGDKPEKMHQIMAGTLEKAIEDIREIQENARNNNDTTRPRWPMIVLRSPKGWTGPKEVDGLKVEGTFRAHQVPLLVDAEHPDHVSQLESWMKSYKAEELFDQSGRFNPELADLAPKGERRMGANPHANGGILLRDLRMPDFHLHAVDVPSPGAVTAQDTLVLGKFLRDTAKLNQDQHNFRIFGPDETLSNLLGAVFEVTNRQWDARQVKNDEFLAPAGRVLDSMLSEHQCEGWLEGYLLTGRHGLFNSYEAFIRIVDSMFSQHAKWLKVTLELPWRRKIASLNYLLASHVWQQDHNGFTHQDPGFLDHVINKKADIVRVYLPPDANCLLSVFDQVGGREKPLVAHVIQKLEKPVVEPAGIEDPDRLEVQAELKPGKYLDHLFESANASRQGYEGIRKLSHAMFAFVHGLNRNELLKAVMCALLGNHRARDDSITSPPAANAASANTPINPALLPP
jgi:xylulose-5-phosphate/fructose-6-phosphate phosphoketolase